MQRTGSGYTDNGDGTITVTAPAATGARKANYWYDGAGRLTRQIDWDLDPDYYANALDHAAYDRLIQYNAKSQVSFEQVFQRQGGTTLVTETTSDYGSGAGYALGALVSATTNAWRTGAPFTSSTTTNGYQYYDGAVLASTLVSGTSSGTTLYTYNGLGQLTQASIQDGRTRFVTYTNDLSGQVIRRDEADYLASGDPHEMWYRFAGREMGYIGNNGSLDSDYQSSVAARPMTPGSGAFRGGATNGSAHADFDRFYNPVTTYNQGGAGGSYTVRAGETLRGIASQLWGDASLWYKLAEANGLGAGSALAEGQRLIVPGGVMRSHNNAATFEPYDPVAAMGDTSPTTPTAQAPAKAKKNGCGAFGQILLTAIAVAVTLIALPSGAVTIPQGILAGLAGSSASQVVGVATGIQNRIDFKSIALSGIAGGVSAGLGGIAGLNGATGTAGIAQDAVRGVLGSAITQGVGVATGLQGKFDFAGVAAAGVIAGVGGSLGGGSFGHNLAARTASGLAGASVRSFLTGTSFGDNVLAVLPDIIGQTVGGLVAETVMASSRLTERAKTLAAKVDPAILDDSDSFASFRSEYKTALKLIKLRDGGDASSATARRLSETYGRLLDSPSNGADPAQSSGLADSGGIDVVADSLLTRLVRRMDPTTSESYTKAAIALEAKRDVFEQNNDGYRWNILPEKRAMALEYLIKAPLLSAGSFVYDNVPIVGTSKSAAQLYTGQDVITGQPVNRWVEGGTLGISLFPFGKTVGKTAFRIYEKAFGRAAESIPLNTKVALQGVTERAVVDLAANPALARRLMSPGSYRHLVEGTNLAPASYGKAVERLSAEYISADPALSKILSYQSRPFKSRPDFLGYEGYNLRPLDITTEAGKATHLARPYGAYTEYVTHPGLPPKLVFPR